MNLHAYIASRLQILCTVFLNFKNHVILSAPQISRIAEKLKDFKLRTMPIASIPANLIISKIPSDLISREEGLQVVLAFLVLLLGFLAKSLLRTHRTRVPTQNEERDTFKALEALLTVLHPPNSRWPCSYNTLARAAAKSGSRKISIPLLELVQDLLDRTVELRDANALEEMIAGQRVYGWKFHLCASEQERTWMKQAQKNRERTWNEVISTHLLCL